MPFIELQTVDSTNNYALKQIHGAHLPEGQNLVQHGLVIFAHEQSLGKGQRGKKWVSQKGLNIALSIVVNPAPLKVSQQFCLSACASVAVNDFFIKYAGQPTKIKWPNDLYWKDRKAGGILIESGVRSRESRVGSQESGVGSQDPIAIGSGVGSWDWAVVGVGINVNQTSFPAELPNPVSLKQITGRDFDPVELAKELCRIFNDRFEELIVSGFENIYTEYLSHLYKINKKVKLKKDNRVFEAIIKKVSADGKLIVQHSMEEEFDFGSIEWML